MIGFRRATWNDREALLELIEKGFTWLEKEVSSIEGEEHRILFSYLYHRPTWRPEWLWVAEEDGQLRATAGYFPQTLTLEEIKLPVAAISPVVSDPQFRGQGLAKKCLYQLMEDLKAQGVPLVFLWGLPFYYPKLGFVPLLPRYKTKITINELNRSLAKPEGGFRKCSSTDLSIIAELYQHQQQKYWLQPCRSLGWWRERFSEFDTELAYIQEVPFPKKENFLVWENISGEVSGYLNYSSEYFNYIFHPEGKKIVINEAVSINQENAEMMLKNFASLINQDQVLYIRGTPEHPLNAAAYRMGGTHLNPAPLAGMVKVVDWRLLLKSLTPLLQQRRSKVKPITHGIHCSWLVDNCLIQMIDQGDLFQIIVDERQDMADINQNLLLTRVAFGLYHQADLQIFEEDVAEYLTRIFPQKYPFIWDINYLY
jgi:predicted N-acetyltransferase YhbS